MNIFELINKIYIQKRRVRKISSHLLDLVPPPTGKLIRIIDIGCGDGLIAYYIQKKRLDITITGCDIVLRKEAFITINHCQKDRLPYDNASFDGALLVDSLHHNKNPRLLLEEAMRVSKDFIIIKDHFIQGRFSAIILKYMDRIGNCRFNVPLPHNYWTEEKWQQNFNNLALEIMVLKRSLNLYPWPLNYLGDRSFHFIAKLKLS